MEHEAIVCLFLIEVGDTLLLLSLSLLLLLLVFFVLFFWAFDPFLFGIADNSETVHAKRDIIFFSFVFLFDGGKQWL